MREMLLEAGVMGGVVNDFFPRVKLNVTYHHKQISFGAKLYFSHFQSKHDNIHCELKTSKWKKILKDGKFIQYPLRIKDV